MTKGVDVYHLTVSDHFMIAHSLPHPAFGPAQNLHGATFVVELTCWRAELGPEGIVIDIGLAADVLREVLADLDYRNLDDHPDLAGTLTTTEALARFIAERVVGQLPTEELARVGVVLREHPNAWAGYVLDL
jgi:6-pyruvoyltetrahydropterin/6-carboxytetrahydropterin synthase